MQASPAAGPPTGSWSPPAPAVVGRRPLDRAVSAARARLPAGQASDFRSRTIQTVLPRRRAGRLALPAPAGPTGGSSPPWTSMAAMTLADVLAPAAPGRAEGGVSTAVDVHGSNDAGRRAGRLQGWAQAWSAWSSHHETVRTWAATALRQQG